MVFDQPQILERIGFFWVSYDQIDTPVSWRMEYLKAGNWYPFEKYITDVYGVSKDRYNTVHPSAKLLRGLAYQYRCTRGQVSRLV